MQHQSSYIFEYGQASSGAHTFLNIADFHVHFLASVEDASCTGREQKSVSSFLYSCLKSLQRQLKFINPRWNREAENAKYLFDNLPFTGSKDFVKKVQRSNDLLAEMEAKIFACQMTSPTIYVNVDVLAHIFSSTDASTASMLEGLLNKEVHDPFFFALYKKILPDNKYDD
ncbi:hypothetical protein POM88_001887 [Heracleum sosnowskyi]|uniref:Uncharacterized protein n=1 Tax=Heracleum sosnowskyi TaxID=360622 RepID=A0AAD8JH19_9APIA|nr:hypothetical protein POM88_001887 [Heracleum sosnowskyi]